MFPQLHSRSTFRKLVLALCLVLVIAPFAGAVELDIVFSEQERASQVTPLCVPLLKPAMVLNSDEKYHKALCLKFGITVAPDIAAAVDLLRELAVQGHGQAQLALADALQQGNGAEQREALHWYERSAATGDSRAVSRAARLAQRLKAQADAVESAPDPFAPGFEDPVNLPPGYHCHRYGRGQQVCHGGTFN